jgi:hypothetical protein
MKELAYHRHLLPAAERYADKVAVYDGLFRATNAVHVDRVLRLGDALHAELGLGGVDHVGVMALDSHAFLELYHAAEFRTEPLPLSGALKVLKRDLRAPTGKAPSDPSSDWGGAPGERLW